MVRKTRQFSHIIPNYDLYKQAFNLCDKFNRNLHDRKDPHRPGGGKAYGERPLENKFIMACILQNTFNAYFFLNNISHLSRSFKSLCEELSNEIILETLKYP